MAATMTGMAPTSVSNTADSPDRAGILLSARTIAMAMKPGSDAIMMPRKLIRFHTLPSCLPPALLPMTGMYLIFHSFASAEMNATARVRLVVPVVPEAEMTLHPIFWAMPIEVPPVPTQGSFLAAAAASAALLTPFGSPLIMTMPSMPPCSISAASAASDAAASALISLSFFSSPQATLSPDSDQRQAGASIEMPSMVRFAPTKETKPTSMPADLACVKISPSNARGSLPPCIYRLPPLLPIIAIFFI